MGILMIGIIVIQLDFVQGFQKCEKRLSRTSPYLEDIFDLLEVPEVSDGDPNDWDHLPSTGFCARFQKMYNTWGVR